MDFFQSFKSGHIYYFLLELCEKGSLADYLMKHKTVNLEVAQYFAAHILTGLETLHNHGVIHRDLKPSNILLNNNYELKLTDFGTAKIVNCQDERILNMMQARDQQEQDERTYCQRKGTFVGTHEYISPEVIDSKDPSPMVDIWGLGIVVYELLNGHTPFRGATEMLTYMNISEGKIKYKDDIDLVAQDFIGKCLEQDPTKRLGYDKETGWIDYEAIRAHPFFSQIQFDNLDPTQVYGLICSPKKKVSRSFAEMHSERNLKLAHRRFKLPNKNSEVISTMDSNTNPKCIISLKDLRYGFRHY